MYKRQDEDVPIEIALSATDVDGDDLTFTADSDNENISVSIEGTVLTLTPTDNYNGSGEISVTANDGIVNSNTETFILTVDPVNDAPVALADSSNIFEDGSLTVDAPGVLSNDSDIEDDTLVAVLEGDVSHGVLTLNSDGSFVYTPQSGFSGEDQFFYRASDGELSSDIATVTITVSPVNDPPEAQDLEVTLEEDGTVDVTLAGSDEDTPDEELSITIVESVSHGTLVPQGRVLSTYIYTPDANYFGADTFTYRVFDTVSLQSDTGTVTITINPVNDAPAVVEDSYTTDEDIVLSVSAPGILSNDSDIEGSALTAVLEGDVFHGTLDLNGDGSFSYTPDPGFTGTDLFFYSAYDGEDYSNAASVTITAVSYTHLTLPTILLV